MWDYINLPLCAAVTGWLSAQIIKMMVYAIRFRTLKIERLLGAGGMPSSHSSTVCALAVYISYAEGVNSSSFAIAMILAIVVMYDATGVRRAAGLHAKAINRLNKAVRELDEEMIEMLEDKIEEDDREEFEEQTDDSGNPKKQKELKEFLGHTPLEVLCGALLGIIIGMLFTFIK